MNHLLHAAFDRFPRLVESRYQDAFLYLAAHCRKRSLVILMTNLIDEVNAQTSPSVSEQDCGTTLPLGVVLRDRQMFDMVEGPRSSEFGAAAAADIICWRQQVLTDLHHQGVLILDAFPEAMTAPLINQYLEIKARHLL